MKRIIAFFLMIALFQGVSAFADDGNGDQNKNNKHDRFGSDVKPDQVSKPSEDNSKPVPQESAPQDSNRQGLSGQDQNRQSQNRRADQSSTGDNSSTNTRPAAIHLDHPGNFRNNKPNYQANQQPKQRFQANIQFNQSSNQQSHLQSNDKPGKGFGQQPNNRLNQTSGQDWQNGGRNFNDRSTKLDNVAHHGQSYNQAYVRKELKNLGVHGVPQPIANRSHLLDTDPQHSVMRLPNRGFDGRPITGNLVSPRNFSNHIVQNHMFSIQSSVMAGRLNNLERDENRSNHFYWHQEPGFSYSHYNDEWGYSWYGWYVGDNYFWTRHYQNRWWWYDQDFNRWCFWNNGGWWWQDPYHLGNMYVYDNSQYVPVNPTNETVVTSVAPPSAMPYYSPDQTREVKVLGDGEDAFLYDTSIPPSFNPIYLASKVTGVKFSNTNNGNPLQVMLTLSDGSFDLFDDQGNPINFDGAYSQPQQP